MTKVSLNILSKRVGISSMERSYLRKIEKGGSAGCWGILPGLKGKGDRSPAQPA